jgi:CheY-like chemotaxis protein
MAQRGFIKVVGFSAAERHALNTAFRLSGERQGRYTLWMPGAPLPPALLLLDGESAEAQPELHSPYAHNAKLIWIGPGAPPQSRRVFQRPLAWPQVIQAIDALLAPEGAHEPPESAESAPVDLDLGNDTDAMDTQPPDTQPDQPRPLLPRALVVSADRDQRLYLRARLALVGLTTVDEADNAGQAVELVKRLTYRVAIVQHNPPQVDGWFVLKWLRGIGADRPAVIFTQDSASVLDRMRAWARGAAAFLPAHPDPGALDAALRKVAAAAPATPALALP